METNNESRKSKMDRVVEGYAQRRTLENVATMFKMSKTDVSRVIQGNNFSHTVDLTKCNPRKKPIKPVIFYGDYSFLDKYPIENFT
jgi:hypothetical protein